MWQPFFFRISKNFDYSWWVCWRCECECKNFVKQLATSWGLSMKVYLTLQLALICWWETTLQSWQRKRAHKYRYLLWSRSVLIPYRDTLATWLHMIIFWVRYEFPVTDAAVLGHDKTRRSFYIDSSVLWVSSPCCKGAHDKTWESHMLPVNWQTCPCDVKTDKASNVK